MFDNKRTPYLGILYAAAIGTAVFVFVEEPDRPLSFVQIVLFYLLSYLPGLGLAMLSDPAPARMKAEYMTIDFYAPKGHVPSHEAAGESSAANGHPRATDRGGTA